MAEHLSMEQLMRLMAAHVPALAQRALAVPTKMLGTVELTQLAGSTSVRVRVDGAESPIDILNATGQVLASGQRVVIDFYPPHGAVVSGALVPVIPFEQTWRGAYTVSSSATVSTAHSGGWELLTPNGVGWADSGNELVCEVPGLWDVGIHTEWATDGNGNHRAARATLNGADVVRASSQFAAPGGTPTVAYGLGTAGGPVPVTCEEGDELSSTARQNSGGGLELNIWLKVRLLGPGT